MRIRYIFFDADDTLWENELFFRKAEEQFVSLLSDHAPEDEIRKSLAEAQEENINDYPMIKLGDHENGSISTMIEVGKNSAVVTIDFQYKTEGDNLSFLEIEKASVKNNGGWLYVKEDATIDFEHIIFANEGTKVSVPIKYEASIGAGLSQYDCCVVATLA